MGRWEYKTEVDRRQEHELHKNVISNLSAQLR